MKKKNINISDLDIEILKILYKLVFINDWQLSILVDENIEYLKGRMKKLKAAGLIYRERIMPGGKAINYISKAGIDFINLPMRNINKPTLSRYEHNTGLIDTYLYFTIFRENKDGNIGQYSEFGKIITERDFLSVREFKLNGRRSDNQPIYISCDKDIHSPDGYIIRNDGTFFAIEYERTKKASINILEKNIIENEKRFSLQFWFSDDSVVLSNLEKLKLKHSTLRIRDLNAIRKTLDNYQNSISTVISAKSGRVRRSCLGKLKRPIPLNKIPVLLNNETTPTNFEIRDSIKKTYSRQVHNNEQKSVNLMKTNYLPLFERR